MLLYERYDWFFIAFHVFELGGILNLGRSDIYWLVYSNRFLTREFSELLQCGSRSQCPTFLSDSLRITCWQLQKPLQTSPDMMVSGILLL